MSLTVKSLNADASFLLTFRPLHSSPFSPDWASDDFNIVLDPWLVGPSKVWHQKFSISHKKSEPCISSLNELPEPDLVIISQPKTDHCHQDSLTQLPRSGGKTIILAEPGSAKVIRGWKYFDANKVITLPKWEDPRVRPNSTVYRIAIPALTPNGLAGEVTVSFLPQKPDITALHNAIGITYRAPTSVQSLPDTPPDTPRSSTFPSTHIDRALSVIFAPHGCTYKTLAPYVTSHLISEAALPLTALLHCFDRVQNAWYMGGNICTGLPGGLEIAQNLCAKAWISAHDGDKDSAGFANVKIKIQKFAREEVENVVSPRSDNFPDQRIGTEAVSLQSGEEITLSGAMVFGRDREDKLAAMSQLDSLSQKDTLVNSTKSISETDSVDFEISS